MPEEGDSSWPCLKCQAGGSVTQLWQGARGEPSSGLALPEQLASFVELTGDSLCQGLVHIWLL